MRKAIKNKLAGSRKLVRRVLSKSSDDLQQSHLQCEQNHQNPSVLMTEEQQVAEEIVALRDQIDNLKAAINNLQNDAERKEIALANIAREKEKITLDLLKQRRSNHHLAQQLEEERKFYHQEKELYCQEMNEIKKLKKTLSSATVELDQNSVERYKSEIEKIKHTLHQTLEANYNLSIKFLRMKNTKTCLKTELKTMRLEREKLVNDYRSKIEALSAELSELVQEKLKSASISASNKKYLQLVKQNSCLVYDNLCLQLEVDNLNLKCEKLKIEQSKSETNSRLTYIRQSTTPQHQKPQTKKLKDHNRRVRISTETPEKLEKPSTSSTVKNPSRSRDEIVTIFERNFDLPGLPKVSVVNENLPTKSCIKSKKQVQNHDQPCCSKTNPQERTSSSIKETNSMGQRPYISSTSVQENIGSCSNMDRILEKSVSKLALFQVSECPSSNASVASRGLVRVQSSPEILQSTLQSRNQWNTYF